MGGSHGFNGIGYVQGESGDSNSFNEQLTVQVDDQSMFLRSMGFMSFGGRRDDEKLNLEGAAELYWERFIEPLQRL